MFLNRGFRLLFQACFGAEAPKRIIRSWKGSPWYCGMAIGPGTHTPLAHMIPDLLLELLQFCFEVCLLCGPCYLPLLTGHDDLVVLVKVQVVATLDFLWYGIEHSN